MRLDFLMPVNEGSPQPPPIPCKVRINSGALHEKIQALRKEIKELKHTAIADEAKGRDWIDEVIARAKVEN